LFNYEANTGPDANPFLYQWIEMQISGAALEDSEEMSHSLLK
jgi:hypothetical protein